jgi:hypothetical protein
LYVVFCLHGLNFGCVLKDYMVFIGLCAGIFERLFKWKVRKNIQQNSDDQCRVFFSEEKLGLFKDRKQELVRSDAYISMTHRSHLTDRRSEEQRNICSR